MRRRRVGRGQAARGAVVVAALALAACASPATPPTDSGTTGALPSGPTSTGPAAAPTVASPGSGGSATAAGPCGLRPSAPATYRSVVWVWLENRSVDQVLDHPSMPALNDVARACGVATGMHAVSHPSLPNYLAAVSGSTGGVTTDCGPRACPQQRTTLFDQVEASGRTWTTFAQGMVGTCRLTNSPPYAAKHNPAVYFPALRASCLRRDLPMGTTSSGPLVEALATDDGLGAFSLLVPGLCDDGHDCPDESPDRWLRTWLPRLFGSPAYRAGTMAVVVTYDEGAGGHGGQPCTTSDERSCRIVAVVASASTRPGTRVATSYSHYSLLRTTEELLGITTYLGAARTAPSMRAAFGL